MIFEEVSKVSTVEGNVALEKQPERPGEKAQQARALSAL